ncbi:hypothetical protein HPB49_010236 [Dermacentor silvarum]|uniref:Uncharacterized protein n=1 Tax=Dermacentor silvarum TaxID=543639 RepID=A0ACB8CR21_DERSI|nr:hypothetical protein HPB49_010236 [Dermacentor silvarum]
MEHNLQSAVIIINSYVHTRGLACSPSKSEPFFDCPRPHDPVNRPISLMLGNHPIPLVSKIHANLGLVLHSQARTATPPKLSRHKPNKPPVSFRAWLIYTRVYESTAYPFPYLPLKQKERDHMNALLRSCMKVALCLFPSTSTAWLLNLGTHNTFEELADATLTAQLTRLSGTATGRTLLCQLGIAPISHFTEAAPLPPDLYSHLVISPIPKNIHPEHDGKRRAARAKALYEQSQK